MDGKDCWILDGAMHITSESGGINTITDKSVQRLKAEYFQINRKCKSGPKATADKNTVRALRDDIGSTKAASSTPDTPQTWSLGLRPGHNNCRRIVRHPRIGCCPRTFQCRRRRDLGQRVRRYVMWPFRRNKRW